MEKRNACFEIHSLFIGTIFFFFLWKIIDLLVFRKNKLLFNLSDHCAIIGINDEDRNHISREILIDA